MKPVWAAVALSCFWIACSGGVIPVEGYDPGPGGEDSPVPGGEVNNPKPPGSMSTSSGPGGTSSSSSSSSSSTTSSSSSGGTCQGCNDLLQGTTVDTPCANTATATQDLFTCACDPNNCQTECVDTCGGTPPPLTGACLSCVMGLCGTAYAACQSDMGM